METSKVAALESGHFEIFDYDPTKLTAKVQFDGSEEIEAIRFYSTDVMDCALGSYIEGWNEPAWEGADYTVEEYQGNLDRVVKVTFPMWWEGLGGVDREKLIKSAIMRYCHAKFARIENELFISRTPQKANTIAA